MLLATDVSAQPIGPTFKDTAVQEELDYLTPDDGAKRLSRNVGEYYQPTSPNILEEGRPHQMLTTQRLTLCECNTSARRLAQLTFIVVVSSPSKKCRRSQINHDRFLPHPFKFIIH